MSIVANAITRSTGIPEFDELIQIPLAERYQTEIELVGCILADPAAGIPIAEAEGIEPGDFCDDGLTLVFAAALLLYRLGRLTGPKGEDAMRVARLAKIGLIQAGFWREHYSHIHPPYFSAERLGALMDSWPSAAMTRHYCRKLIEINQRIKEAGEHLQIARKLIQGEPLDDVLLPLNRNSNWKSHLPERGTRNGLEVAA